PVSRPIASRPLATKTPCIGFGRLRDQRHGARPRCTPPPPPTEGRDSPWAIPVSKTGGAFAGESHAWSLPSEADDRRPSTAAEWAGRTGRSPASTGVASARSE